MTYQNEKRAIIAQAAGAITLCEIVTHRGTTDVVVPAGQIGDAAVQERILAIAASRDEPLLVLFADRDDVSIAYDRYCGSEAARQWATFSLTSGELLTPFAGFDQTLVAYRTLQG